MPALQVRDCPQDLYDQLVACAKEEHRSISQQMIVAIEEYLKYRERQKEVNEMLATSMPLPPKPWEAGYAEYRESERAKEARMKRRREVLDRIYAQPIIDVPDDFPSVVEIVREARESR